MKKVIFIYNPNSGKSKVLKNLDYITSKLKSHFGDLQVIPTTHPGHAGEIAKSYNGKVDVLVVAGGDGTLNEVINGLEGKACSPVIAYIPCGTVNDVAHSLKIPRNIKKAVDLICKEKVFEHDIFKINNRFGIYVACSGVFTETSYKTNQKNKKKFGKIAYFFHGAKKLFTTKAVKAKVEVNGQKIEGNFAFIAAVNSRNVAGFKANRKAVLNDGKVDLVLAKNSKKEKVTFSGILRTVKIFLFGVKKHGGVNHFLTDKFTLTTESDFNIDGEGIGVLKEYLFEVIPKGVKIFVK